MDVHGRSNAQWTMRPIESRVPVESHDQSRSRRHLLIGGVGIKNTPCAHDSLAAGPPSAQLAALCRSAALIRVRR